MPRCFLMFFFRCLFAMFAVGLESLNFFRLAVDFHTPGPERHCSAAGFEGATEKRSEVLALQKCVLLCLPKNHINTHHAKHGIFFFIFWTMEFRAFSQLFGTPQHKRGGFLNGDLQIIHVHNGFFVVNHPFGGSGQVSSVWLHLGGTPCPEQSGRQHQMWPGVSENGVYLRITTEF